ncbi:MAG TPA: diguanylate cyclase [Dongiaceae bacterium]|nr:diguanylate cyclase [Dongiaceae bacterium]
MLDAVLTAGVTAIVTAAATLGIVSRRRERAKPAAVQPNSPSAGLSLTDPTDDKARNDIWRHAIAGLQDGVALLDAEMAVLAATDRYAQALGLTPAELPPGRRLADILRQAALRGAYDGLPDAAAIDHFVTDWLAFLAAPAAGEAGRAQRELRRGDGTWLLVSRQALPGGGILMLVADITAQKAGEQSLLAARDQAEQRARDMERYIGDVEEARTRVERQAADYVGLMEELAEAQNATQRAHAELQHKEEQLRRMTDALPVLVADIDAAGIYRYCNDRYLDFFDLRQSEVVGQHLSQVVGAEAYAVVSQDLEQVLNGKAASFRRALSSQGEMRQLEGRYTPQVNTEGVVEGFYVAAWDVTEQYRRELELDREVKTDALTGLLNRRALLEALDGFARDLTGFAPNDAAANGGAPNIARQMAGEGEAVLDGAVMFLDIDHFKQINDTLGHAAGDQLLKIFAQRLRAAVRTTDHVARLGGDEFVVLLTDIGSPAQAEKVAQKILDRMRDPVGLDTRIIEIGTSIGIVYSRGQQVAPEQLLQEADTALYEAKKAGRGVYRLHLIRDQMASA